MNIRVSAKSISLAILTLAFLATGCVSNHQFVKVPDLSKPIEDPTKARIYVCRPSASGALIGGVSSMEIWDTGTHVGNTGPSSTICWEREPGKAVITGREENNSTVELTAEAGQRYYIFQHVYPGLAAPRNRMELVSTEKGEAVLKRCRAPKTRERCFDHPECRSAKGSL